MRTGRRCGTAGAQRKGLARGRRWVFAGPVAALLAGGWVLLLGQSAANPLAVAAKPVQIAANPTQSDKLQALQPAAPQGGDAVKGDDPRQQIQLEADNLLRMANELMIQIDRTQKDTLSLAVVRKASEIEQLAHKMKDQ